MDDGRLGVQMSVHPDNQIRLNGIAHCLSSLDAMLVSGTGLEGNPAAIL
jgi:hypothetical protein